MSTVTWLTPEPENATFKTVFLINLVVYNPIKPTPRRRNPKRKLTSSRKKISSLLRLLKTTSILFVQCLQHMGRLSTRFELLPSYFVTQEPESTLSPEEREFARKRIAIEKRWCNPSGNGLAY